MGIINRNGHWYVDYYFNGRRIRESVGTSKRLAETVLAKRKAEIAEGRFLLRKKEPKMTFSEMAANYLDYSRNNKKSFKRDILSCCKLKEYFGDTPVKAIVPEDIENFRTKRRSEKSYRGTQTAEATINRELSCLRHMLSRAERDKIIESNPFKHIKLKKEENERDRVLSEKEYEKLKASSPGWLRSIIITAYCTAMRLGELLNLTWDMVDLENGFIRLSSKDTKTGERRSIPLTTDMLSILSSIERREGIPYVFLRKGQRIKSIKDSFETAIKKAQIEGFTFHDLRHTCITNWRRAGIDNLTSMKMSGHKSLTVFKRYNTVEEMDLLDALKKIERKANDSKRKEEKMYIKKEDFNYLEGLCKGLDEAKRKRLLGILIKEGSRRSGEDVSKIKIIGDEIFDVQGIDPSEMITRTMIKKAYREVKEG